MFSLVAVNNSGEPAFISLAGANRHLSVEDIKAAELFIKSCQVVICDKGIPLNIAEAALQYSKELGKKTVFNPSPKLESLPRSIYLNADSLIVNREEGESLTNTLADDIEGAKKVICKLHQWGAKQIVLTLGSEGAISSEITSQHSGKCCLLSSLKISEFTRSCTENHSSIKRHGVARVVVLMQILLIFNGRCNRYFSCIRLKIYRLPNFNKIMY